MNQKTSPKTQPWMRGVLLLAGAYNFAWGLFMRYFPDAFLQWMELDERALGSVNFLGLFILLEAAMLFGFSFYLEKLRKMLPIAIIVKLMGAFYAWQNMAYGVFTKKIGFHVIMVDGVWSMATLIIFLLLLFGSGSIDRLKPEK